MKTTQLCPQCGQSAPPDALLGLCPRCMLKVGAPGTAKPTIAVSPDAFVEGPETETKEFVPGTRIGYIGDYELLEEIARGGMGVVYKARQSSLKRIVAVKTIRAAQLASEVDVRRFHTEAEAAAQLQHPNIVAIHEIGEHQGQHYFSMDFVEGRNLAQVANGKPVPERSAAEWLKTIAGAVQFAHQRGVLHRDLKPQNIMVDSAGRPRVMDFGLAKTLGSDSSVTKTGTVMGSPSYMSPEQALGRNDLVGPSSDVYSLGAILYELLTGRPPFRGKSMMETLSQVVNDEPPPPRSLHAETSVDLESICLKCLEKDQARRYPTARELEADLGRFLEGEPVQAKPANALRKTMSWFRRHPWVFSGVVSVLMLAMTGLAYGLWEQTRFLIWSHAHPGVAKPPEPQSDYWAAFGDFRRVLCVMYVFSGFLTGLSKRFEAHPARGKVFSLLNPGAPGLGLVTAVNLAWYGGLWIGGALLLVATLIRACVWQAQSPTLLEIVLISVVIIGSAWYGVRGLIQTLREKFRIPVERMPEKETSPPSHARPKARFIRLVIFFLSGLALVSVSETFSQDNLIFYSLGFAIPVTGWFGLFLLRLKSDAGSRQTESRALTILAMATMILAIDLLLAVFGLLVALGPRSSSPTPNSDHTGESLRLVFIFGLVAGGLPVFYILPAWIGEWIKSHKEAHKETAMAPELLEPIHEAIFAGRTDVAVKLYQAASGKDLRSQHRAKMEVLKIEGELSCAQPERFTPAALDRSNRRGLRYTIFGFAFSGVLAVAFLPSHWYGPYFWASGGLSLGALFRTIRFDELRETRTLLYRGMRPIFKILMWIEIALGAWVIVCFFSGAWPVVSFIASSFRTGARILFLGGLIGGWILSHLWLKEKPSGIR